MKCSKVVSTWLTLILAGFGLSGCGGGSGTPASGNLRVILERNPLQAGEVAGLQVALVDAANRPLPAEFQIESSAPLIAQAESAGDGYVVRALAPGRARLTVRERRTGQQTQLEVVVAQPAPVAARLEIIAERTTFLIGERTQFRAVVYDQTGQPVNAPIMWSSSNPSVMRIYSSGAADALAAGTVRITAQVRDTAIQAAVTIQVTQSLPGSGGIDLEIR